MATPPLNLAMRFLQEHLNSFPEPVTANYPQLKHCDAMRIYNQLRHGRDTIGVRKLRILPAFLLNVYRARLREGMEMLDTALEDLKNEIESLKKPNDNAKLSSSWEVEKCILNIIEQLTFTLDLFYFYAQTRDGKKRKRISQFEKANEVLNRVGQNIVSIVKEYNKKVESLWQQVPQLPTSQLPTSQLPTSQLPTSQLPTSQLPTSQLPTSQLPTSRLPTSQLPTSRLPISQLPISQLATS